MRPFSVSLVALLALAAFAVSTRVEAASPEPTTDDQEWGEDRPEVLGVVLSPFERRVAVLVSDQNYAGCIGARPSVHVFGADLDARFP